MLFGWRANYSFLLALGSGVTYVIFRWLPETLPIPIEKRYILATFRQLLKNSTFICYLIMMISALAGIVVFESSGCVLMNGVLNLSSMTVSVLFILPIPAALFGAWHSGGDRKTFHSLMWRSVLSCALAGLLMWAPSWFGVMNIWTLIPPAALFFFDAGMIFPLATTGAMEPFPYLAGAAGSLVGGMQNLGTGVVALFSATLSQTGQFILGLLMFSMAFLILVGWWILSNRMKK